MTFFQIFKRIQLFLMGAILLPFSISFGNESEKYEFVTLTATETVSDIASSERFRELYPGTQLYGQGGRLQILLSLNPDLRTGVASPGTKIILSRDASNIAAQSTKREAAYSKKVGLKEDELAAIKLKVANVQTYIAQQGDTMSYIAWRFFSGAKLYGVGGRLELLMQLNPHIENKNSIFPGDLILIDPHGELKKEISNRALASERLSENKLELIQEPILATDKNMNYNFSHLIFTTGGNFYRIDTQDTLNDTVGTLLSTLSPVIKLSWEPRFDQKKYVSMGFEFATSQWGDPVGRSIQNNNENLSAAYFNYVFLSQKGNRVGLKFQQQEFLAPRALTTEIIRLEKFSTLQAGAELLYNIKTIGSFHFDGLMSLGLTSATKAGELKIKQGHYYGFGLELVQTLKKYHLKGSVNYSQNFYDSGFSDNEFSQLQFLLSLGFKLEDSIQANPQK